MVSFGKEDGLPGDDAKQDHADKVHKTGQDEAYRTGQEFKSKTGEILSYGTGAVHGVAEAGKEYLVDKIGGVRGRVLGKLFDALDKQDEGEEDERLLAKLRSILGGTK